MPVSAKNMTDRAVKKLIEKYQAFKPKKILFEDYGFQHIYKQHIVKQAAAYKVYLPIVGANTGRVGKERILKLSPLIENGLLSFKAGSEVVGQLLDYPKSTHDDLQDALFYAVNEETSGSSPKPLSKLIKQLMTLRAKAKVQAMPWVTLLKVVA